MNTNFLSSIFLGLFLMGMTACVSETVISDDGQYGGVADEVIAVKFTSKNLATKAITRTTLDGSAWTEHDVIGIYMLPDGASSMEQAHEKNRSYKVDKPLDPSVPEGPWSFTWDTPSQAIFYPEDAETAPLRFIAYYPHKSAIYNYKDSIDIANQDSDNLDVLYSENVRGHLLKHGAEREAVDLQFQHLFARMIIHVKTQEGTDIKTRGMRGIVDKMPTQATILLDRGLNTVDNDLIDDIRAIKPFYLHGVDIGTDRPVYKPGVEDIPYDTTYTAVVIPHQVDGDRVTFFTAGGGSRSFIWPIPTDKVAEFEAGKLYTFWITLEGEYVTDIKCSIQDLDIINTEPAPNPVSVANPGTVSTYLLPNKKDTMKVVFVPKKQFKMGGGAPADKATSHTVNISEGFLIGQTPVTWEKFVVFMNDIGANSSRQAILNNLVPEAPASLTSLYNISNQGTYTSYTNGKWVVANDQYKQYPVVGIYYYAAKAYAVWAGGDLPTEAQWELAARANVEEQYAYIDGAVNGANIGNYAVYNLSNANFYNSPYSNHVYSKQPNPWNIYGMFGYVREWTRDLVTSGSDYEFADADIAVEDPCANMTGGTIHPLRGGYYGSTATDMRIFYRDVTTNGLATNTSNQYYTGFRVAFFSDITPESDPQEDDDEGIGGGEGEEDGEGSGEGSGEGE